MSLNIFLLYAVAAILYLRPLCDQNHNNPVKRFGEIKYYITSLQITDYLVLKFHLPMLQFCFLNQYYLSRS